MRTDGSTIKYILEDKKRNYRGFIYVRDTSEREREASLKDLYNNYYYENNIAVKKARYRNDWVDPVHFNNQGKKACHVNVTNPKHSDNILEVTCRYCIAWLGRQK